MGCDDDSILAPDHILAPRLGFHALPIRVLAGRADFGDVGVVVGDFRAEGLEAVEELECRGFAHVIDIGLVGEAEEKDAAAFDGFPLIIESNHGALDHVFGHPAVDLAGEFDEAGVDAVFAGLPGEVEGVDRDAVAAEAGSGVERGEAEGLGGGGADDLPDIDVHRVGDDLEFVDEADVDSAVDVFQQFGQLRDLAGADGDDGVEGRFVKRDANVQTGRGVTADDLGDVGGGEFRIAGILALRGVNHEHRFPGDQPAGDHAGDHFFVGGPGIGGALQRKDGTGFQMRDDGVEGVADVGKIRFEMMVQRGGHAENDGIRLGDAGEIRGGIESPGSERLGDLGCGDVLDVALAAQEMLLLRFVDIKADDPESGSGVGEEEGKTDVAEADNGDGGGFGGEGRRHGVKLKI